MQSLFGRDFISPQDFTAEELKTVLWSAKDMKCSKRNIKIVESCIKNCNATVIMNKPLIYSQVVIFNALNRVGCTANFVTDECWEKYPCSVMDLGRALSQLTNVIIAVDCEHDSVNRLRDGATVPVVNFSSSSFKLIECLANLLTVQECYGFLKGLKIGWAGFPDSALITYISLAPKFQMKVQFTAECGENLDEDQAILQCAIQCATKGGAEIAQFVEAKEAVYRAHVIITALHTYRSLQITREILCEAAVNWILLHHLPRSDIEVTSDVFYSKNSLVWEAYSNQVWVLMAVVTHLLREYLPEIERLDFEGCNVPIKEFIQP